MTRLDETTQPQISGIAKVWQRMPVLLKAILLIALVGIVGANGILIFAARSEGFLDVTMVGMNSIRFLSRRIDSSVS